MSNGAMLSVLGLYNVDNTIFDFMQFPDAFTAAQKQTVIDNILVECAEFECLYPVPLVMKNIIGIWSRKESPYWNRVYNASLLEYNPIENYRRHEEENIDDNKTEEHSGSDSSESSGSDEMDHTGTILSKDGGSDSVTGSNTANSSTGGEDTTDHNITGFDSNDLVPNTQDVTDYGKTERRTETGNNTSVYGKSNTQTLDTADITNYGKKDVFNHGEKIDHEGNTKRNMLAYGNIGVTTSQEMLTQEMEIAKIIQVIPIIIDSFKNRFCLLIY